MKTLNIFNTLTLIQIIWKAKTFFKKLEDRLLVGTTKIESRLFPFKTALSEGNVMTNEWRLQNGPISRSGVLPVTTLYFRKIF